MHSSAIALNKTTNASIKSISLFLTTHSYNLPYSSCEIANNVRWKNPGTWCIVDFIMRMCSFVTNTKRKFSFSVLQKKKECFNFPFCVLAHTPSKIEHADSRSRKQSVFFVFSLFRIFLFLAVVYGHQLAM